MNKPSIGRGLDGFSSDLGIELIAHDVHSYLAISLAILVLLPVCIRAEVLTGPIRNPANGHDYYLLGSSGWSDAEKAAVALGGHLATINDASEQEWVYTTFSNHGGVARHLWIGFYDANRHENSSVRTSRMSEFIWISGEASGFQHWSPFEPNDGGGGGEECTHIWAPTDPFAGFWNDLAPTTSTLFNVTLHGVVEVTHVPPPRGDVVVNPVSAADVFYVAGATRRIEQIVGDFDRERGVATRNLTDTRFQLWGTDLGIPFRHRGVLWVLFGDTIGVVGGDRDTLARSSDEDLEDGLQLNFISSGRMYTPLTIPGITQAAFEVPSEGISVNNTMYVYHTTDNSSVVPMGRSVLAASDNNGGDFRLVYTLSQKHFINVSVVKEPVSRWRGSPARAGDGLFIFGSGPYRQSNVRLAFQPDSEVENRASILYFSGLDPCNQPNWSPLENQAISLFQQPCVGEFSVTYNPLLRRWLMTYNCDSPRGINFRTALFPWGPWSEPQVFFDPWADNGYCHFMHASWSFRNCDAVHDPGRENEWGGEYGPYLFKDLYQGTPSRVTFYFTLSTWNPYTVMLMKTQLARPVDSIPQLRASLVGSNVRLIWPCAFYAYRLLAGVNLTSLEGWQALPQEPELSNEGWFVDLPPSDRQQYFRLDLP